jgi:tryptophanyl-tRNA synthetase
MKRIVSGIKPTGDLTLGNYIGAMKHWAALSQEEGVEHFFFMANLHALNARPEPKQLHHDTRSMVAWLLACGVDPQKSYIFVQSQVPAHSELANVLNNFTTVGELNRMTQYKDKAKKSGEEGQLVGLYNYPVLMAADVLLYDATQVPVGDDQKQHVELTRDIATRFNNIYGDTFTIPEAVIAKQGARVMNLQDPTKKMSKSDVDDGGSIYLTDDAATIRKKITRAVTDSGSVVASGDDKPALTNLLVIYSELVGKSISEIEEMYAGKGYGDFKKDLAELVVKILEPIQTKHAKMMEADKKDKTHIDGVLEHGWWRASELSNAKLGDVKEKLGLV